MSCIGSDNFQFWHAFYSLSHITINPKVIWEEPCRHPSHRESHSPLPSNTPIPRPMPLITSNSVQIQSAVLSQYRQTDRQTHGISDRPVRILYYIIVMLLIITIEVGVCTLIMSFGVVSWVGQCMTCYYCSCLTVWVKIPQWVGHMF